MATFTINYLTRPRPFDPVSGTEVDAPYLLAEVKRSDGEVHRVLLAFADYSGLEAEWETGTATTVLDAAVDAQIAATPTSTPNDALTSAQRAFVAAYEMTEG